jgi:hypothetical protein
VMAIMPAHGSSAPAPSSTRHTSRTRAHARDRTPAWYLGTTTPAGSTYSSSLTPLSWLRIPFHSWMCGIYPTIRIPTTTSPTHNTHTTTPVHSWTCGFLPSIRIPATTRTCSAGEGPSKAGAEGCARGALLQGTGQYDRQHLTVQLRAVTRGGAGPHTAPTQSRHHRHTGRRGGWQGTGNGGRLRGGGWYDATHGRCTGQTPHWKK